MKRIVLITAAILMMTFQANAQGGLGGLLGKLSDAANSEGAGALVSSITDLLSGKSALTKEAIVGTWNYTGSAVSFKSENNALSNIASGVAQSTIEKKLDGYLQKVGISQGLFGFTFNEDGTMVIKYGSKTFNGTWDLDKENAKLIMKVASFVNMKGYVAVKNGKMELLFDATTMMKIVKSVTSVYKNSTLQTINGILNQYDQMYAGFRLTK